MTSFLKQIFGDKYNFLSVFPNCLNFLELELVWIKCQNEHFHSSSFVSKLRYCRVLSRILIFYAFRIPDLGSWIPDPKTATKEKDEKIICQTFFCSHKFHKIENYFIFEMLKKKIWVNFLRIII